MLLLAVTMALADTLRLPIGRGGEALVEPGTMVDLRTNRPAHLVDLVRAANGKPFVFVGEQHATPAHQRMEAAIVEGFAKSRATGVGVEFITRPKQGVLDDWSLGRLDEEAFLKAVDWKGQWGFDYALYRPLFEICRTAALPLIGLNVPRDWVRSVGRGGQAALTPQQRAELPKEMPLDIKGHRQVFESMMGGHPLTGPQGENMYAAQVLWDEGMAHTALRSMSRLPKEGVMIVIAGSGHIMYGQGINKRVERQSGLKGISVVMLEADGPITVSKGIADFVYVSEKGAK